MRKVLASLLVLVMAVSLFAGCKKTNEGQTTDGNASQGEVTQGEDTQEEVAVNSTLDTMVIGVQPLDGVFNPLFSSSAYDNQVNDMLFPTVSRLDKDGVVVDYAGHVDMEEIKAEDGHAQFKYTVTLKKDLKFTDGEPVTIDDVLFTYYVFADPTYDGSSTLSTLDIIGMKEYYYDTADYSKLLADLEAKYSPDKISKEDFISYLVATKCDGWFDGTLPGDVGDGRSWVDYLKDEGYDASKITTPEDMLTLVAQCEYEKYASSYDPLSYYKKQMVTGTVADGIDVKEISGIQRIDDYTCTVLFNSPNISGDKLVAWQPIMAEHYYGKSWTKGDLSSIKELNSKPMSFGPYKFISYDNNLVTLEVNKDYFLGSPKIPNMKFQVVNEEDKVDVVIAGDVDVTDPSASVEIVEQLKSEPDVTTTLVDNPGYGYIGINTERIPDVNVRKGLMHLMNRAPAVSSYYADLGKVIERPMTPTLAEYPDDAKEYYGYSKEKALEFFKKAGYEQKDGKLVKDGKQLKVIVGIGNASTHPSTPILTQMTNDMADMGAELVVNDLQFNVLSPMVKGGELDMWVMAWGNATDCDLTQIFGSKGGDNYQRYYDPAIDAIQEEILKTLDFDKRCELVAKELDMIMDAAVYMPVYQRKNMEIFNTKNINAEYLPKETTTYYNYVHEIEKMQMN